MAAPSGGSAEWRPGQLVRAYLGGNTMPFTGVVELGYQGTYDVARASAEWESKARDAARAVGRRVV